MLVGIPKRVIQRYLYEFRVPLRYSQVRSAINSCMEDRSPQTNPQCLIAIKRALEAYRKRSGRVSRESAAAETALLESAAEMGDYTAIALLCGARLSEHKPLREDEEAGSKLLKQLMDKKFPLAFKVSGDLAYGLGRYSEAKRFYELAIENGIRDRWSSVECLRNIGHIAFREAQLYQARQAFFDACKIAEKSGDVDQVGDCHFYLAQLRESDRNACRRHLERAASTGLSDSFVPLGLLLLNYFGEPKLASEWFQLALATDKTGAAAVGLFDAMLKLKNMHGAQKAAALIPTSLRKLRSQQLSRLAEPETHQSTYSVTSASDRWNF